MQELVSENEVTLVLVVLAGWMLLFVSMTDIGTSSFTAARLEHSPGRAHPFGSQNLTAEAFGVQGLGSRFRVRFIAILELAPAPPPSCNVLMLFAAVLICQISRGFTDSRRWEAASAAVARKKSHYTSLGIFYILAAGAAVCIGVNLVYAKLARRKSSLPFQAQGSRLPLPAGVLADSLRGLMSCSRLAQALFGADSCACAALTNLREREGGRGRDREGKGDNLPCGTMLILSLSPLRF